MTLETKELTGMDVIRLLAPLLGVDPGMVRRIEVTARYDDIAIFTIEMLGQKQDAPAFFKGGSRGA